MFITRRVIRVLYLICKPMESRKYFKLTIIDYIHLWDDCINGYWWIDTMLTMLTYSVGD